MRASDGKINPTNIASGASFGDTDEDATYTPKSWDTRRDAARPPLPDRGRNWCTRDADDDPTSDDPADTANCGIGEDVPNEDDFVGSVTLGPIEEVNSLPSVTLTGPDSGRTGERLAYTAAGSDPGGAIVNYRFDLDGDGFFESNTLTGTAAATAFADPGTFNVGVQATDNAGDTAYASKAVKITGSPVGPTPGVPETAARLQPELPRVGRKEEAQAGHPLQVARALGCDGGPVPRRQAGEAAHQRREAVERALQDRRQAAQAPARDVHGSHLRARRVGQGPERASHLEAPLGEGPCAACRRSPPSPSRSPPRTRRPRARRLARCGR